MTTLLGEDIDELATTIPVSFDLETAEDVAYPTNKIFPSLLTIFCIA